MTLQRIFFWLTALLSTASTFAALSYAADDILITDFEASTYVPWTVTGNAFGNSPATGTLPNQHAVTGFSGKRLVNTFRNGDEAQGTATSPEFTIRRHFVAFLIGGGNAKEKLGIELLIGETSVRSATGSDDEELNWSHWDVSEFVGRKARLRIFDRSSGGWGHINVDRILQTDTPPKNRGLERRLADYRSTHLYMSEPLRPQYHFSPEINWMNDPNGLVYHDGEYHLFHQYNPKGNSWGHMSWGHAISNDLVNWKHLPLAIAERDGVMAFSGCCIVDSQNTAGFGSSSHPAMVAIYTGHGHGRQVQNLAISLDRGRTWTPYKNNPVLDLGKADFRDPKVFWHETSRKWIMVVSLAVEKVLVFYGSTDLKTWNELSRFGPAGVINKPNWECPDLFPLPVDDERDKQLWVLEADMGDGAVAGGSGGEYFVGTFDGREFKSLQSAQWVDYGRDFYAPICWDNLPESDRRRIWIGWFNNWQTCMLPTSPWRSCMSVPRELSLRKFAWNDEEPPTYVLVQRPIKELETLRIESRTLKTKSIGWPPKTISGPDPLPDLCFELEATLHPGNARSLGFRIRTNKEEFLEIAYDRNYGAVYVDRSHSGNVSFQPKFAGRHHAPARISDGTISLRIMVDRSTIEVFVNGGEAVISDRFFPSSQQAEIEAFSGDDSARISEVMYHRLRSVWRRQEPKG